eukprot:1269582-Alexandrium_andersonii.AAC.1
MRGQPVALGRPRLRDPDQAPRIRGLQMSDLSCGRPGWDHSLCVSTACGNARSGQKSCPNRQFHHPAF